MKKNNNLLMIAICILVLISIFFILTLSYLKKPNKDHIKEIKELAKTISVIDNTSVDINNTTNNEVSKNIIFIINTSSNLTDEKLTVLKDSISENIELFSDDTAVCIITFDEKVTLNTKLAPLTNNKDVFLTNIQSIKSNRKSCNYDALIYGLNLATENSNCEIIYICTNSPTNGKYTYNDIKDALPVINCPIHTISYGEDTETSILSEIARETNGKFIKATTNNFSEELKNILNN